MGYLAAARDRHVQGITDVQANYLAAAGQLQDVAFLHDCVVHCSTGDHA